MRFPGRLASRLAPLLILLGTLAAPTAHAANEVARLYAPKPPAGSAYLRVIDLSGQKGPLSFEGGAATAPAAGEIATLYRIVKGGTPLALARDGKPAAEGVTPPADSFSTLVLLPSGAPRLIPDPTEGRNDLKAQLRFYNLAAGCPGAVAVQDGPTVFEGVATFDTRQRSINPIEATLVAHCGDKATAPLKLPPLKAGDHFSLFLVDGPSGPVLDGQRDETEPYRGPAN